ncbi:MAG: hypothetical protein KIT17_15575 [Rubrivivax sp.]|nr:hypothetical protein [Rubrivivax sp.]
MRRTLQHIAVTTAAGLAMAGAAFAAQAASPSVRMHDQRAASAQDVVVRSGGASVEDFAALNREASDYSLKLITAAKGSGAYLADVDVVVRALPSLEPVLEHRTEGPLLLATLPPGRYEVTATYGQVLPGASMTQRRIVTVGSGLTQMVMYWETGDQVAAESPGAYRTHDVR